MLSNLELFLILVLNPLLTGLIVYFLIGNRLLAAFSRMFRSHKANMKKQGMLPQQAQQPINSGNWITDTIGAVLSTPQGAQLASNLINNFMNKDKPQPPSGGNTLG